MKRGSFKILGPSNGLPNWLPSPPQSDLSRMSQNMPKAISDHGDVEYLVNLGEEAGRTS